MLVVDVLLMIVLSCALFAFGMDSIRFALISVVVFECGSSVCVVLWLLSVLCVVVGMMLCCCDFFVRVLCYCCLH